MENLIRCSKCSRDLPADSFYPYMVGKSGRRGFCKECHKVCQSKWADEHREGQKAYRRNWARQDRTKKYAKYRKQELRKKYRKYGLTEGWYEEQFAKQNGVCAICGKPEMRLHNMTKTLMPLSVDHNHATGKVRGLLCWGCNLTLHRVEDSGWLNQSLEYLRKFDS